MVFQPGFMFHPNLSAPVTTITLVTSSNSSTTNFTVPATAAAGDLVVLLDAPIDSDGTPPTSVVVSGWTLIGDVSVVGGSGNSGRCVASYKIISSGDVGASFAGMTGTNTTRKIIAVYRPDNSINSVVVSSYQEEGTTGNPTSQTITAGATPQIQLGHLRSTAGMTPSGTLESTGTLLSTSSTTVHKAYSMIYNSSPSSLSIDVNDTGEFQLLQSFCISLS